MTATRTPDLDRPAPSQATLTMATARMQAVKARLKILKKRGAKALLMSQLWNRSQRVFCFLRSWGRVMPRFSMSSPEEYRLIPTPPRLPGIQGEDQPGVCAWLAEILSSCRLLGSRACIVIASPSPSCWEERLSPSSCMSSPEVLLLLPLLGLRYGRVQPPVPVPVAVPSSSWDSD